MTVPRGCIYGLLGASGCGKTTLVRCALGRMQLDAGQARLLGQPPDAVAAAHLGYMPQDAALPGELSVGEALMYFGRLFAMSHAAVDERQRLLATLLQLPDPQRLLKTLSGGERRRASLAVTLVHQPELLFLDEPTVGLDPVIRHSIWEYLIKLTECDQTTVIITTHYIQEAQQAHIVGFMRFGKLLAEDCPKRLIMFHSCVTLEEVFLNVSVQQENAISNAFAREKSDSKTLSSLQDNKEMSANHDTPEEYENTSKTSGRKERKLSSDSFNRLKALICKNFIIMCRYPGNIMGIFLLPFLQTSLFFLAIGGYPTGIKLAVFNEEIEVSFYESCILGNRADSNYSACDLSDTSCMYLRLINKSKITLEFHTNMADAKTSVTRGEAIGVIHFHKDFSKHLEARFLYGARAENETIYFSEIGIQLDMTEQHTASLIKSILYEQYNVLTDRLYLKCNIDNTLTHIPMRFHQPIYGIKYPQYDVFMVPGVLTSMMYFLATTLTAVIMIRERQEGIWSRDIVAGVTPLELLISHMLCQSTFIILQCIEIIVIAIYIYGMECRGNVFLLFFILLLQGFCGLTFGLVIAVLSSSITGAMYLCMGIYVPFINLSGVIWPIEGMPKCLQWVSYMMPTTLATISTSNVLQKAWQLWHPQVLHGIIATLLWVVGQMFFSVYMLKELNITGNKI